jgi:hypothetical protein
VAKNRRVNGGNILPLTVPSTAKSGDPFANGTSTLPGFAGVLLTDPDATTNVATVDCSGGLFNLSVKGVTNGAANSAVVQGDQLFYNPAHTPKVDKDTTGIPFGVAWEPVNSGATTTIGVRCRRG